MDDKFIRKLLSNMKCGVCGQRYESSNISVLGHREDLWFLSVFCPACKSQGLVAAVVQEGKLVPEVTDLTEAEKDRFETPVDANDLIDLHSYLQDFDGDFANLFKGKRGA